MGQVPDCIFVASICFSLLAFSKIRTYNILVEPNISSLLADYCESHAFREDKINLSSLLILFEGSYLISLIRF